MQPTLSPSRGPIRLTSDQVVAFRLSRHHLSKRAPLASLSSVAGDMMGAQAQVLSAAQMSLWARVNVRKIQDVDSALWNQRSLVRMWCMRRTLFLLPSTELAVFARGTTRRSEYGLEYVLARVHSKQKLEQLLDAAIEFLDVPRTRKEIAGALKEQGYKMKFKAGGGWGDRRSVPWVEVSGASLPIGFLIHIMASRAVICSGPSVGNESTYVRAEKWLSHWKDFPRDRAEEELLVRYLKAFGPATIQDFAIWIGLYVRDAKEIWLRVADKLAEVNVGGLKAWVLQSDLQGLGESRIEERVVRMLPFFDSFILGHKSHQNIVDDGNMKKVYRSQGWVAPVLLIDGRSQGVWSHVPSKKSLEVRVSLFSKVSSNVLSKIREEASSLGQFHGYSEVNTVIS